MTAAAMTSLKRQLGLWLHRIGGRKPFSRGYTAYRQQFLDETLKKQQFNRTQLPKGYGYRMDERVIEYPWLLSCLPAHPGTLLDAGSVLNFEWLLTQPQIKNKRLFISTLAPEQLCFWQQGISYVYEDLRMACYRDQYFDWVVCLSTLEHVGLDNTRLYTQNHHRKENCPEAYLNMVQELNRILKPNGRLYLSVPFGAYKNHGWLQVFNQAMVEQVIEAFSPTSWTAQYFQYQIEGWQVATADTCKGATYFDWHQNHSYDSDYAAAARAVVCLEMVK